MSTEIRMNDLTLDMLDDVLQEMCYNIPLSDRSISVKVSLESIVRLRKKLWVKIEKNAIDVVNVNGPLKDDESIVNSFRLQTPMGMIYFKVDEALKDSDFCKFVVDMK